MLIALFIVLLLSQPLSARTDDFDSLNYLAIKSQLGHCAMANLLINKQKKPAILFIRWQDNVMFTGIIYMECQKLQVKEICLGENFQYQVGSGKFLKLNQMCEQLLQILIKNNTLITAKIIKIYSP